MGLHRHLPDRLRHCTRANGPSVCRQSSLRAIRLRRSSRQGGKFLGTLRRVRRDAVPSRIAHIVGRSPADHGPHRERPYRGPVTLRIAGLELPLSPSWRPRHGAGVRPPSPSCTSTLALAGITWLLHRQSASTVVTRHRQGLALTSKALTTKKVAIPSRSRARGDTTPCSCLPTSPLFDPDAVRTAVKLASRRRSGIHSARVDRPCSSRRPIDAPHGDKDRECAGINRAGPSSWSAAS